MKPFLKCLLLLFVCQTANVNLVNAQKINAVIPGDFADPSVIRKGNTYYAVGTSSEWAPHFPIFKSKDLQEWSQVGYVFDKAPEWTVGSFWAPEYFYHNKTYFLYYTARRKKDNASYIGVATSKYPDRDFKDHGVIIEYSKEAIDAFVYNDDGQLYITFKAYGLDGRPIEIIGSKLSADGLKLEGELFTMLKDDKGMGLEGQSFLKKDGYYYMFYSAGACCGAKCDYNVRIARSKTFQGPYEDYEKNPVLAENADWKCSGHGTFVTNKKGKTFYLYHAYSKESMVFTGRQGLLAELTWPAANEWPVFKEKLVTAEKPNFVADFKDDLSNNWQWDFRNSTPVAEQKKGNLHLSGTIKQDNLAGIAYTLRPAYNDYEMTTTVSNHNDAQKGLVIYGDANAAIGVGVTANKIEFWQVRDKTRKVMASLPLPETDEPVALKMNVSPNLTCTVYWKQGKQGWQHMVPDQIPSISFLPQWDRSPRVGLNFKGTAEQEATFSSFTLTYR